MRAESLLLLSLLSLAQADETLLGAFVFHRHGDRTAKAWPPAKLTDLGYSQVFQDGGYYRDRYITGSSPIAGIAKDIVTLSQLSVEAPVDIVLQPSAMGWLQGVYPPVGPTLGAQKLANGTSVESPLNGSQLIPVNAVSSVSTGTNLEDQAWLQGSSGCANAIISSNNYFISQDYISTKSRTDKFYQSVYPVVNDSFTAAYTTFKNAYSIYDLINVATIHNLTINSDDLLTKDNLYQLRTLADQHEFGLAYNSSEPIRAIAGATLAAQILQGLNLTIHSQKAPKLNVQFGAYASFLSFFGLAQLPANSENFTGIVDYASSMAFELVTNSTVSSSSLPSPDNVSVRFMFSNGSAVANGLAAYPLFGQSETTISWNTFMTEMGKIAIGDQASWCSACGNTTGICASATSSPTGGGASSTPSASSVSTSSSEGSGISTAVGGVIGAMVTLAVILGLEALILLVGGIRLVSKKSLAARSVGSESASPVKV